MSETVFKNILERMELVDEQRKLMDKVKEHIEIPTLIAAGDLYRASVLKGELGIREDGDGMGASISPAISQPTSDENITRQVDTQLTALMKTTKNPDTGKIFTDEEIQLILIGTPIDEKTALIEQMKANKDVKTQQSKTFADSSMQLATQQNDVQKEMVDLLKFIADKTQQNITFNVLQQFYRQAAENMVNESGPDIMEILPDDVQAHIEGITEPEKQKDELVKALITHEPQLVTANAKSIASNKQELEELLKISKQQEEEGKKITEDGNKLIAEIEGMRGTEFDDWAGKHPDIMLKIQIDSLANLFSDDLRALGKNFNPLARKHIHNKGLNKKKDEQLKIYAAELYKGDTSNISSSIPPQQKTDMLAQYKKTVDDDFRRWMEGETKRLRKEERDARLPALTDNLKNVRKAKKDKEEQRKAISQTNLENKRNEIDEENRRLDELQKIIAKDKETKEKAKEQKLENEKDAIEQYIIDYLDPYDDLYNQIPPLSHSTIISNLSNEIKKNILHRKFKAGEKKMIENIFNREYERKASGASTSGAGIGNGKRVPFGKVYLDKKKLDNNMLSVSYANGMKINKLPNRRISNNLKQMLKNSQVNTKTMRLNESEMAVYNKLVSVADVPVSTSKKKVMNRYYSSLEDMLQRLTVLLGEINSGNNSNLIKNESLDIIRVLEQSGKITSSKAKSLIEAFDII